MKEKRSLDKSSKSSPQSSQIPQKKEPASVTKAPQGIYDTSHIYIYTYMYKYTCRVKRTADQRRAYGVSHQDSILHNIVREQNYVTGDRRTFLRMPALARADVYHLIIPHQARASKPASGAGKSSCILMRGFS